MGGNELENFRDFRSLICLVSQPSVGEHAILEMPNIPHWAVGKQSLATVNARPRVCMYSTLSSDAPITGVTSVTCPGRGKLLRGGEYSLGVYCPCPHVSRVSAMSEMHTKLYYMLSHICDKLCF